MLELKLSELNDAIQNNPANTEYLWSTHLCPDTGTLVNLSSTENGDRYEVLIPVPSMDPEGSGEESTRFQEFSEEPPEDVAVTCYQGFCESSAYREYPENRDGYFEYAKAEGWTSVEDDWENWETEHLDYIRQEWIDGLKTGNLDSLTILDACPSVEIVLV